jgi:tRNA nucleotidyltransferase (CCA-adding enzyme)
VPQPPRWHPEIDTGVHVMMALRCAVRLGASLQARFAVLVHDLGKAITRREAWPSHHGHEELGVRLIEALSARLRIPGNFRELAVLVARHHGKVHRALELRAATILELLEVTDAFRRAERFSEMLLCCEADARGRAGLGDRDYPQAQYLRALRDCAAAVELAPAERAELSGAAIGAALRDKRLAALQAKKEQAE